MTTGARFVIRLPSNPTTGYRWILDPIPDSGVARLVGETFDPSPQPRPGAAGTQAFRFAAIRPGEGTLRFDYVRPWQSPLLPLEQRTVRVVVEP
ncbi:MAG TPA: protease inhibitor I42 family protein [Dermatophilaceae bacterium]|nr:protease inhibitor I42 family protein [Dermatophilaceae bacterium]